MTSHEDTAQQAQVFIEAGAFQKPIAHRHQRSAIWRRVYLSCVGLAALALFILLAKIVDDAMGYIAIADVVNPDTLMTSDGRNLEEQSAAELSALLRERTDARQALRQY